MLSAKSKRMKVAGFLLLAIACARASVNPGVETLAAACRIGNLKTAQSLLENGVNPNAPDRYGKTPLYYAASFNETQTVELLLASHADPNVGMDNRKPSEFPATPLQIAAYMGNLRVAETLIAAGARMDATGPTALHFAVRGIHLDIIHYLLEKGADLNVRDAEGTSPLDEAVWNGSIDAVAILLAHGARLNEAETKTGATPINEAAYRGNTRVVQYLLQFHPDLDIRDKEGYSPLENAARRGKEAAAVLLLEAEPRPTSQSLKKVMSLAITKNEPVLAGDLLRRGAVASDALEDASLKGSDAIVGVLLDHGALMNQVNSGSGTTALYAAASFGKSNVVKLLLNRGASPNLCGTNRKTPYRAALENGYTDIANQIKTHGGNDNCRP
jgi:ankyrin repeat protein